MYEAEFRTYIKEHNGPSWETTTTEVLDDLGADVVFEGLQASPTRYQIAFRDGVEQIDGKWLTKYSVSYMNSEAIAAKDAEQAKSVRATRDAKLAETDWRFRSDMTPSQEWKDYCQALRDVPLQSGFPWTIEWPDAP